VWIIPITVDGITSCTLIGRFNPYHERESLGIEYDCWYFGITSVSRKVKRFLSIDDLIPSSTRVSFEAKETIFKI
jgi:hypothetical protein